MEATIRNAFVLSQQNEFQALQKKAKNGKITITDNNGQKVQVPLPPQITDANLDTMLDTVPSIAKKFQEFRENAINSIPFNNAGMRQFIDNAGAVMSYGRKFRDNTWRIEADKNKTYIKSFAPIANHILSGIKAEPDPINQTTGQFMKKFVNTTIKYQTVYGFKINEQDWQMDDALRNIKKKSKFVLYDLEGTYNDITEYAFVTAGTSSKTIDHVSSSIIGYNDSQYQYYLNHILEPLKRAGMNDKIGVDPKDRYIVDYLARVGDKGTKISYKDGRAYFDSIIGNDKVIMPTIDAVKEGIERLHEINRRITSRKLSYNINGKTYQIYGYEQDMLQSLVYGNSRGLTFVHHNGLDYDNNQLQYFFTKGSASADAKKAFADLFGNDINKAMQHQFDSLSAMRSRVDLRDFNDRKLVHELTLRGDTSNTAGGMALRYAPEAEKQAIEFLKGMGVYVPHVGLADAVKQAYTQIAMMDHSIFDPSSKKYAFRRVKDDSIHVANVGDVFFVNNGNPVSILGNREKNGLLSFQHDQLTGNIQFSGGVSIAPDGSVDLNDMYIGPKKNQAYMLTDMHYIELSDEYAERLRQGLGPDVASGRLVHMSLMPMGSSDPNAMPTFKSRTPIEIVTSLENASRYLSRFGNYIGTMNVDAVAKKVDAQNGDGTWESLTHHQRIEEATKGDYIHDIDVSKVDKKTRSMLTMNHGDGLVDNDASFIEDIFRISDITAGNDTAARFARRIDYNKASMVIKFFDTVEKKSAKTKKNIHDTIADMLEDAHKNTINSELADIFDYNGSKNPDAKRVYSGTIDNVTTGYKYFYGMKDLYSAVIQKADSLSNDVFERSQYFNILFQEAMSYIDLSVGRDYRSYNGKISLSQLNAQSNMFSIDVRDLRRPSKEISAYDINSSDASYIINIDPYAKHSHFGKSLARKIGLDPDIEGSDVQALRRLQTYLSDKYDMKFDRQNKSEFNAEYATEQIIGQLREFKKKYPYVKTSRNPMVMDMQHAPVTVKAFFDKYGKEGFDRIEKKAWANIGSYKFVNRIYQKKLVKKEGAMIYVPDKEAIADNARKAVDYYLDNYLFKDTRDIKPKDLYRYGYSKDEAERMIADVQLRRSDAAELLYDVFNRTVGNYEYMDYKIGSKGELYFIDSKANKTYDFTRHMMFDHFDQEKGIFYSQLGGRRVASITGLINTIGPDETTTEDTASVHSVIGKQYQNMRRYLKYMDASDATPDKDLNFLNYIFMRANETIGFEVVNRRDEQDKLLGNMFNLEGLFQRLGYLNGVDAYKNVRMNKETRSVLHSLTKGLNELREKSSKDLVLFSPSSDQIGILYGDLPALLDPFRDKNSIASQTLFKNEEDWERFSRVIPQVSLVGIKNLENNVVSLTSTATVPFMDFGSDKRHLNSILNRTHELVNTKEFMKDDFVNNEYHDIIRFGTGIRSNSDAMAIEETGEAHDHFFRVKKLGMSTTALKEILATPEAKEVIKKLNNPNALENIFLEESAGIMDPELLGIIKRNLIQTQRTDALAEYNKIQYMLGKKAYERELEIRRKTLEVIKLAQDGSGINFKYGEYENVSRGDTIAFNEAYTGTVHGQQSKDFGLLSVKYQNDNDRHFATEDEINKILNRKENIERIKSSIDYTDNMSDAEKALNMRSEAEHILSEAGYSRRYIVETIDAQKFRKMADSSEKTMSEFVMSALGTESKDDRLQTFLNNLHYDRSRMLYLANDMLEDRKKFAAIIGTSAGDLDSVAKKSGFKNGYDDFVYAAKKERRMAWDTLMEVLQKASILKNGEYVSAIDDTMVEAMKDSHQEGAYVQKRIGRAIRSIADAQLGSGSHSQAEIDKAFIDARHKLFKEFSNAGVITDAQGNNALREVNGTDTMAIQDAYKMNVEAFNAILDKHAPLDVRQDKAIMTEGVYAAVSDADRGGPTIKATRRLISAAQQEIWGQNMINKVYESYKNLEKTFGSQNYNAEEEFNKRYKGIATASGNSVKLEDGIAGTDVNSYIIDNVSREIVGGSSRKEVIYDEDDGGMKAARKRVRDLAAEVGVESEHLGRIVENVVQQGYKRVGSNNILSRYAYASATAAVNLNEQFSDKALSYEEQLALADKNVGKKKMFQAIVSVGDLLHVLDNNNVNDINRILSRPIIIDMGKDIAGRNGAHFVALPFIHASKMDDRKEDGIISRNEVANKASSIAHLVETYNNNGETARAGIANNISDEIDELQVLVNSQRDSKTGAAAQATTVELNGSYGAKHRDVRIDVAHVDDSSLLKRAMVDGKSVAELAKAGRQVNAIFMGRSFFKNALLNDETNEILKTLGSSGGNESAKAKAVREAMLDDLKTNGAIGYGLRQPVEYMNSVMGAHIFYDESLGSNEIVMTERMAKAMKADSDGDVTYIHMARDRATISTADGKRSTVGMISQAQARLLEKMGFNIVFNNKHAFEGIARSSEALANSAIGEIDTSDKALTDVITSDKLGKTAIDNLIVDGMQYSQKYLDQNRTELAERYERISSSDEFNNTIAQQVGENIRPDELSVSQFVGSEGVAQTYLNTIANKAERSKAGEAIAYHLSEMARSDEFIANAARSSAGLANATIYGAKTIVNTLENRGLTQLTDSDSEIVGHLFTHFQEATIAAKNTDDGKNAIQKLSTAIKDLFGVGRSDGISDDRAMREFISGMGNIKEFKQIPLYDDLKNLQVVDADGNTHLDVDRVMEAMNHITPENQVITKEFFNSIRQGYGLSGSDSKAMTANKKDPLRSVQETSNKLLEEYGDPNGKYNDIDIVRDAGTMLSQRRFHYDPSDEEEDLRGRFARLNTSGAETIDGDFEDLDLKSKLAGTMKALSKDLSSGHKGAIAMLGFAGATMMAGIMGGAPTSPTPAQGQAQGIQSDNAMYELPSVMPNVQSGNNAGYIINVNASTDRGREFATDAINNAMSRMNLSQGGNTSMTMNIKDSASNISYSNIASYVSSML